MQDLIKRPEPAGLGARFTDDRRGTTTVTAAAIFPLFIIIMMGFLYILWALVIQWQLTEGTREASQHISEMARYWNISGTQATSPFDPNKSLTDTRTGAPLPAEFYDLEARRIIAGRLRDMRYYSDEVLSATLAVTVTEPPLAHGPSSPPIVAVGLTDRICEPKADQPGEWREPENIRFLVLSSFRMLWPVRIPFMAQRYVTLHSRSVGYVQCPRWLGQRERGENDKSYRMNVEGPSLPYRYLETPSWPTITPEPSPTATFPPPPSPTP